MRRPPSPAPRPSHHHPRRAAVLPGTAAATGRRRLVEKRAAGRPDWGRQAVFLRVRGSPGGVVSALGGGRRRTRAEGGLSFGGAAVRTLRGADLCRGQIWIKVGKRS